MKVLAIILLAFLTIALTVGANLLLKRGAHESTTGLFLNLVGWQTFAGFIAFGLALIAYTLLLRFVPLHFAASITAAKFIGIVLAAWFVLHERVNVQQWAGMAMIAVGILVVSLAKSPDEEPAEDTTTPAVDERSPS